MQSSDAEILQAGYRYALALTHDRHEAEDLVHDAWIKLHERARLFRGRGYFLRTVRNLFIDRYRRNRRILLEPLSEEYEANTLDEANEANSLNEEQAAHAVYAAPGKSGGDESTEFSPYSVSDPALSDALAQIRPQEREALFLNAVEGLSAAQIVRHTGRSRSTVLSLIHRGKIKLQRILIHEQRRNSP